MRRRLSLGAAVAAALLAMPGAAQAARYTVKSGGGLARGAAAIGRQVPLV